MSIASTDKADRVVALDMLRGVAILLVIGAHIYPTSLPAGFSWLEIKIVNIWRYTGWAGVDLFFVLSGFLVSGLLFREYLRYKDVHIGRFLIRRGFKIYPAFYVFLAITLPFFAWRGSQPIELRCLLSEIFFVQNYGCPIWIHTWSLAVEEHSYLALALFFLWRSKTKSENPFKIVVPLGLCIMIAELILRIIWYVKVVPFGFHSHESPTHLRSDGLVCGVLLSYFYHFHPQKLEEVSRYNPKLQLALYLSMIASGCIPARGGFYSYTLGLTFLYLGFAGLLFSIIYWKNEPGLLLKTIGKALAIIGFYSYSIYLWHAAIERVVAAWARDSWTATPVGFWLTALVYIVGSIATGIIMAKIIEVPFLRWRDQLFPSRSQLFKRSLATAAR